MKTILTILLSGCMAALFAQRDTSHVWIPDNGDGTYKNPVINADYSDPDAIRVGDDYYMISSSFNHVPGLPILHSTDLVNWRLTGHALKHLVPADHFSKVQHGGGVWAPSIRYHNKEFYIYYPDPDFGIYLVKARNITGPWSDPLLVEAGKGLIDPCPLWDSDGRVYLVHAYAGSRAGIKSLLVVKELNSEGTRVISKPVIVYEDRERDPTIEGPKFYKRNGYYYIFAPAGGVSTGWQTVLRSKKIYGPYERRNVMDQGSTSINGPHQGAWIDTKTGEHWFLHFQDVGAAGRVVHLQPMKWINDWPVIGEDKDGDGKGQPVLSYKKPKTGKPSHIITPSTNDDFDSTSLGLQWQWQANPGEHWAFPTNNGSLRMFAVYQPDTLINPWNLPNILGQKFPGTETFAATIQFRFFPKKEGDRFGFVVLGTDYAALSIVRKSDGLYLVLTKCTNADKQQLPVDSVITKVTGDQFSFRLEVGKGGACVFRYSAGGKQVETIPGIFIAKPGKWVSAKIGMYCSSIVWTNDSGYAEVDKFELGRF
jgi:beta-xylosidase